MFEYLTDFNEIS